VKAKRDVGRRTLRSLCRMLRLQGLGGRAPAFEIVFPPEFEYYWELRGDRRPAARPSFCWWGRGWHWEELNQRGSPAHSLRCLVQGPVVLRRLRLPHDSQPCNQEWADSLLRVPALKEKSSLPAQPAGSAAGKDPARRFRRRQRQALHPLACACPR